MAEQDLITISDSTPVPAPPPGQGMGLIPRDFVQFHVGYYEAAPAFSMRLMSDQEIEEGIRRQAEEKSSLQDIFHRHEMKALDQNGQGYCWAYSTTSGIMLGRVAAGLPYVRLSGHHIGCLVKGYRDQGGWNSQSVDFASKNGVASVEYWGEKSMSRSNDTAEMRANAKLHMALEYMDLDNGGERLKRQIATCLLNNIPIATDYNWWGHSVMAGRLISWRPFKTRILNSWARWSDRGWGDLEGSRAIPNGAIAIFVSTPSLS